MRKNQAIGEDYSIEVEQELTDKPIMNSTEYLSNLFVAFGAGANNMDRAIAIGKQIIASGRSLFKSIITAKQENRIKEIINKLDELSDTPINRRSKHRIPKKEYREVCEGVGIIIELADLKGLIIREKQIRENTIVAIDGGLEGFAPASRNITQQSDEVFDKYNNE